MSFIQAMLDERRVIDARRRLLLARCGSRRVAASPIVQRLLYPEYEGEPGTVARFDNA